MQILRLKDVRARLGTSRSWIYDQLKNGRFPKPIQLGPRSIGWLEADIEDWLRSKGQQAAGK